MNIDIDIKKIWQALKRIVHSNAGAAVINVLLAYLVFMLSRVAFLAENWSVYSPYLTWKGSGQLLHGALVFDTSALLYVNALYLLLELLPLHLKERRRWTSGLRWLYVVTNGIAVASNLCDAVYFQYTGRRSTVTVFSEFANEGNITSIILSEFVSHWYLVLVMAAIVFLMWRCFTRSDYSVYGNRRWLYYTAQAVSLLIAAPLLIIGIRGSATAGTRPITVSNANQYISRPVEAALVLNTPFSMIRSIGKKPYITPDYMSRDEMERVYQPIIRPATAPDSTNCLGKKNVVILIVESMGKEYVGSLNHSNIGEDYKGYMPFIDSLLTHSLTFEYSFANGRISMDAMPAILAGIPMFVEPFFLTPASLNEVHGLPWHLKQMGYSSAFFHGGHNISMGFSAFAHAIGYDTYYGLDEYCNDKNYGGMDDFDGKWAIWDEPFLQFTLDNINNMREPFLATTFTASSHHPYNVPEKYESTFTDEGGNPIHKCVRYTDMALRRFFERASRQPWYNNTIFVLVADHTNQSTHPFYKTDQGLYSIPIIFFTPDGSIAPGVRSDVLAQQTDISPTLLHWLGYTESYVSFGCDLLSTPAGQTWAVNYNNGIYQYFKGDLMMQFDGEKVIAIYRFKTDPMLRDNLAGKVHEQAAMEHELKAIIQQYMSRMNENRLTI